MKASSSTNQVFPETMRLGRPAMWQIGFFSLFINLLMLTLPLYMMQVFDGVIQTKSYDTLIWLTLLAMVAMAIYAALEMIRGQMLQRLSTWMDQRLSAEALRRCIVLSLRTRASHTGVLREIINLRNLLSGPALTTLFDSPWVPIYLLVIWLLHPVVGLVATIAAIILFCMAMLNEFVARKPLHMAGESGTLALRQADTSLRNAEAIVAMGMVPAIVERWMRHQANSLTYQQQAASRGTAVFSASKFWRMATQIMVLGSGAYFVLQQEMTPGSMIAGSILLGRALAPVEGAIGSWKAVVQGREAHRMLERFFNETDPGREKMPLPAPRGFLDVQNVRYSYPTSNEPILRGVNFTAQPGEVIAIIGPSAAGKSTLARLVIGLYEPQFGHVRLDDADVTTWDRTALGEHLGYLPQDVELFAGTVAENIARMRSAASEDIVDAAKLAGVHEMILQLQHGYDTEIGEAGFVLSGGQRQRVGLARAIFGQPSLLVLDEPNASLDQDGEAALNNTIETMKRSGTTILLIAHKPTMLAHVDKILFLQDGMVGAFGERNEVLKQLSAHRAKTRQVAAAAPQPGQITPPSGQPPAGSVSGPAPPSTGAPDAAPPERP